MARSTYIYLVLEGCVPKAAFTVKHEMMGWLKSKVPIRSDWHFYRMVDNPNSYVVDILHKPSITDITEEILGGDSHILTMAV